ncbi:class I SAM-dependent methyltransferase [Thermoflavimicrobium daqui]|jgi:ubiquinone/menaquinone biosynthesis C-methylase UbiE|uniref:SAM-dependent methyltransferase n=1 Tax=Thermoflavimicrobium daqui TaxID=2137476 RepID=A0A364K4Q0_9BACL|nr:methyltransferase domain-containing protein [Thermoflavimicrobium daqui]RAL24271.1 SAM-dependent methyltransferase [Thermoflavimicrobium daqui]
MDKKSQVVQQFNQSAESYLTSQVHAKGIDLHWLKDLIVESPHERALDIATGAGHTAFVLSEFVKNVIALDLTPNMLQVASVEADRRNITNISFVLGDAEALPFINSYFDLVTCRIASHHFPHIKKAIKEMVRVLCKQGLLILIDNFVPSDPESAQLMNSIEKLRDPSHVECLSIEQWQQLLNESGFSEINCYRTWTTQMNIPEWLDRAKTSTENRQKIFELIDKTETQWIDQQMIHLQKVMWVCRK